MGLESIGKWFYLFVLRLLDNPHVAQITFVWSAVLWILNATFVLKISRE